MAEFLNSLSLLLSSTLESTGFLIILIHLLGLIFAVHAMFFGRTAEGTIAWMLGLIFVPYLSILLYIIFGHQRFRGYIKVRQKGQNELSTWADKIHAIVKPFQTELPSHLKPIQQLNALGPFDFTDQNHVRLLINGDQTFSEMFKQIELAEEYILVQFYIVRDDQIGLRFKDALIEAIHRGIRVYFIYDEIGSHQVRRSYLRQLKEAGIQISRFNTLFRRNRFQINFRNHRKLLIRDGIVAMLGGHNLGDEYLGDGSDYNQWRDTHIVFTGPSVVTAQLAFFEDWYWATEEQLDLEWERKNWDPIEQSTSSQMLVLPTGPADHIESGSLTAVQLINSAKFSLTIVSPYFVPDRKVIGALQLAALRGIKVKILIPSKSDNQMVKLSSFTFIEEIEPFGIETYTYQNGFLHEKVILVDEEVSMITTANIDNRSLRINFEIGAIICSPEFGQKVKSMLDQDFAMAKPILLREISAWPWHRQILMRLARLFAPIQ